MCCVRADDRHRFGIIPYAIGACLCLVGEYAQGVAYAAGWKPEFMAGGPGQKVCRSDRVRMWGILPLSPCVTGNNHVKPTEIVSLPDTGTPGCPPGDSRAPRIKSPVLRRKA